MEPIRCCMIPARNRSSEVEKPVAGTIPGAANRDVPTRTDPIPGKLGPEEFSIVDRASSTAALLGPKELWNNSILGSG
jgi:hypothetical protein